MVSRSIYRVLDKLEYSMLPICFQIIPPPRQYFRLEEATAAIKLLKAGQMKGRGIIKFD